MSRISRPEGDLATVLATLETQDVGSLRTTWQRLYRASPPDHISRDLLTRAVAHRLQEAALGGLRPAAKRKLVAWSGSLAADGGQQSPAAAARLKLAALTHREREIVRMVVEGLLNKEIADALDLALITVKVHRGRAMHKLGAGNSAELAHLAALVGISS